jgi:hypothetical protein
MRPSLCCKVIVDKGRRSATVARSEQLIRP